MSQAFHARLPSSQKLVLLVLCDYANDEGLSCRPSIAQVAKKASLSERQCKRVMKELIDGEWIAVIGNEFGGAPGSTRNYKINLKTLFRGDTSDTPEQSLTGDARDTGDKLTRVTSATETGDKSCTRRVTNRATTGDTHDTQSTIEPSIEPPKNHQSKCPPNVSPRVWDDYRAHRKAKRAALTPRAIELITSKLASLPQPTADACLLLSIENGWTGVFPERFHENRSNSSNHGTGKRLSLVDQVRQANGFGPDPGGEGACLDGEVVGRHD